MKIILEYRKPKHMWNSFSTQLMFLDHFVLTELVFGKLELTNKENGEGTGDYYWLIPSEYTVWTTTENLGSYTASYLTTNNGILTTCSTATLNNLYSFYEYDVVNGIPVSARNLKFNDHEVAILSLQEFECCLDGIETGILDYEAMLIAGKYIESKGYEVRIVAFKV